MKTEKNDWLLRLFRSGIESKSQTQTICFYEKTEEEIMQIANSYRTHYSFLVSVYKLQTVL